jgi:hypothetical protein
MLVQCIKCYMMRLCSRIVEHVVWEARRGLRVCVSRIRSRRISLPHPFLIRLLALLTLCFHPRLSRLRRPCNLLSNHQPEQIRPNIPRAIDAA